MTTNHCIDYIRKTRNLSKQASLSAEYLNEEILTGLYIACGEQAGAATQRSELRDKVNAAIAQLSDIHREVFILFALKEMSYKDIAEVVGCSTGTVMSRLFYARKYLQDALAGYLNH